MLDWWRRHFTSARVKAGLPRHAWASQRLRIPLRDMNVATPRQMIGLRCKLPFLYRTGAIVALSGKVTKLLALSESGCRFHGHGADPPSPRVRQLGPRRRFVSLTTSSLCFVCSPSEGIAVLTMPSLTNVRSRRRGGREALIGSLCYVVRGSAPLRVSHRAVLLRESALRAADASQ